MKYRSGDVICVGDRVTYNGQEGCIALIGSEDSGCCGMKRPEWTMRNSQLLIVFDNGARLMLDQVQEDDHLVLRT
jgi:hypothetical protein